MAGTTQITDFMRIRGSSHHHTGALDIAVMGTSAEALLSASAISQLDIVTVKVFSCAHTTESDGSTVVLTSDSMNAIFAVSPQLCRALTSTGESLPASSDSARTSGMGARIPHTPSARGIHADVHIRHDAMTDILAAPLPRGMLQPEMQFMGVKEEVNGVRLKFQAGETLQAKLLVVCGDAVAAVAGNVGGNNPWGRGRIAVIPKAADGQVNAEAAVELAYSLSEHGLTPAAFRSFAMSMARHQECQQGDMQQRAFPPVAQPEALKGSATSSMGSSPCGSLKMQEVRPFESTRGLQNFAA